LGFLDTSGTNPATGMQWSAGDTYHLVYVTGNDVNDPVTGNLTDATSTSISDYNTFVQNDASGRTAPSGDNMGSVDWSALGSTTSTDAVDNVNVTAPVINAANSGTFAEDADDLWDFSWDNNPLSDLNGGNANIWTGTAPGGTADAGDELGADDVRRHWSGWTDWGAANANSANTESFPMAAVSEQLTVVPEPASLALFGLGGLMLLPRRRRS
jgi:hypothetical protein